MNRLLATIQGTEIWQLADQSLSYVAGMTVDADGSPRCYGPNDSGLDATVCAGHPGNWWGILTVDGEPLIQGPDDPAPGMYVSTTSLQNKDYLATDPRRYLNAELVPFVVIPGILAKQCSGVALGCKVLVQNIKTGDQTLAVCGDIGPSTHLGEVSMKVASIMGVNNSPRIGGDPRLIYRYTFDPGTPAQGYSLQPLG